MGVEMVYRLDRYLRGGDHKPFVDVGYVAARFTEPHGDFTLFNISTVIQRRRFPARGCFG